MNKQTVYIPIEITEEFWKKFDSGEIPDYEIISCRNGERLDEWVDSKEGYFFTPEELKQLLEDYTNRIVENTKLKTTYIDEVYDSNFEDTALPNEEIFLRTDNDGMPYAANKVAINKESITSQLPKFLKEKGL